MKQIYLKSFYLLTFILVSNNVRTQEIVTISDGDINEGDTVTWVSDKEYHLDGYVFVEEGAVLTIQPGTVIKGLTESEKTTADPASALIISRGAKIYAQGTVEKPIIFTSSNDDVEDFTDLLFDDRGQWGGVVILGYGIGGFKENKTEFNIEGIPTEGYGAKALYGGDDNADNSGILRYVSIRHGGFRIAPDNELNGLTLGCVGSETVLEFIETFAIADDGIEWFGGAANIKFAISAFNDDEAFDYDQGWDGKGQFFFAIQAEDKADRGFEIDGSEQPEITIRNTPMFSNLTIVGAGKDNAVEGNDGFRIKSDGAGHFYNSVFTDFSGLALRLDDQLTFDRFSAGDILFRNNYWFGFGAGESLEDIFDIKEGDEGAFITSVSDNQNTVSDPMLTEISRTDNGRLNPFPTETSPLYEAAISVEDDWFDNVSYVGAFGTSNWAQGWTALDQYGILSNDAIAPGNDIFVTDATIEADDTVTWTANNSYFLDGYVFVEEGAVLTIEPGTVIKGLTQSEKTSSDPASALIISRGAKIYAQGTVDNPIIFTSSNDDISDFNDLLFDDRGQWGGLVVLGYGIGGFKENATEFNIEGIPTEGFGDKALYGGDNNADNSGIIQYVSIRHGGFRIAPDNELNGLTLGCVGSETVIDHIETFAIADDGIEWFGGAVSIKYAISAFNDDEAFDYDQGWDGNGQFFLAIQGEDKADRGFEIDGSEQPEITIRNTPTFSNLTMIGAGTDNAVEGNDGFRMKSDGSGHFYNSVFTEFSGLALRLDDQLTFDRFSSGDILFRNNYWFGFGAGESLEEVFDIKEGDESTFLTSISDNQNVISNPALVSISRTDDKGLNPLPAFDSPLRGAAIDLENDWFDNVDYIGAFGNENWAKGWTGLDEYGILSNATTNVEYKNSSSGVSIRVENPALNSATNLFIDLPANSDVKIKVFDLSGKLVNQLQINDVKQGSSIHPLTITSLSSGMHFITLESKDGIVSNKFTVIR